MSFFVDLLSVYGMWKRAQLGLIGIPRYLESSKREASRPKNGILREVGVVLSWLYP